MTISITKGDVFESVIAKKLIAVIWANQDSGTTKIEHEDGETRIVKIDSVRRRYNRC